MEGYIYLMLQAAVLALCVLSNDDNVNVLVAGLNPRQGPAVHHVGIQVQTGPERQKESAREWVSLKQTAVEEIQIPS